ncbi:MAG: 4Fe-4S binding protein [Anaerolineae bacterium]|nr:4Fe-4S binding protein [Anaerolineae bacterium]
MSEEVAQATEVQEEAPAKHRTQKRRTKPIIFPNWCKGCALCVEFCPKHVLEQTESGSVIVAHPDQCIGCRWCELHCPDFAIFVTEIESEEKSV